MLVLWHEKLRNYIDDAGLVGTECGGKLRAIKLACFAICFIVYSFASSTKRSRLTGFEEVFEVIRRRTILVEVDCNT